MRRVLPFVIVAVIASAVTAAAIVIPARAGDRHGHPRSASRIAEVEACMRERGFDISGDTEVIVRPGEITINGKAVDADAFRRAERECGPPFGRAFGFGPGPLPRLDPLRDDAPAELRERMERLRACLEQARKT